MGRLKDFRHYLEGREKVLTQAEKNLCALQEKYESFFAEVSKVREAELGQLTGHVLADRTKLPDWFNKLLDSTGDEVESEFDETLAALETKKNGCLKEAEDARRISLSQEKHVLGRNSDLDAQEEELKGRSEALLARIGEYNSRIRALGGGFGFFVNFFRLRGLAREKGALEGEQADLAARIEKVRSLWKETEADHAKRELAHQERWRKAESEAAALAMKIEALRQARPAIVVRTTLERILDGRARKDASGGEGARRCPRCGTTNPDSAYFCSICALRLGEDRPDFDRSLEEIAEVNFHFRRFAEGMKACQEIIGLVRGITSGVQAFTKSVADVEGSEKKYPLPKLQIDVPKGSLDFGTHFDRLLETVKKDHSLHPKVFAEHVQHIAAHVFTEGAIKGYFERMGDELSRQAKAQW